MASPRDSNDVKFGATDGGGRKAEDIACPNSACGLAPADGSSEAPSGPFKPVSAAAGGRNSRLSGSTAGVGGAVVAAAGTVGGVVSDTAAGAATAAVGTVGG